MTSTGLKTYFEVFHYGGNPDDQEPCIYEPYKNNETENWPDFIFHDELHHLVKNQKWTDEQRANIFRP